MQTNEQMDQEEEEEEELVDSDDHWEPIENRGKTEWSEAIERKM